MHSPFCCLVLLSIVCLTTTNEVKETPEAVPAIKTTIPEITAGVLDDVINSYHFTVLFIYDPRRCPSDCETSLLELDAAFISLQSTSAGQYVAMGWMNANSKRNERYIKKVGVSETLPAILSFGWWDNTPRPFTGTPSRSEFANWAASAVRGISPFVPLLTPETAKQILTGDSIMIAVHCGKIIGVCDPYFAEFNEASHELYGQNAGVAIIGPDVDEQWAGQFFPNGAKDFKKSQPTLSLVVGARPTQLILAAPSALQLVHTLYLHSNQQQSPEFFEIESVDQLQSLVKEHTVFVLFNFNTGTGDYETEMQWFKLFEIFVFQNRELCHFGIARNNAAVQKATGMSSNGFMMLKTFDQDKLVYEGQMTTYYFRQWIRENFFPLVSDFSPQLYPAFVLRGFPIVYLMADPHERRQDEVTYMRFGIAAQMFHSVGSFVHANITEFPDILTSLNITPEELPAVAVEKPPKFSDIVDDKGKPTGAVFRGVISLHVSHGNDFETQYFQGLLADYMDGVLFDEKRKDGDETLAAQ